MLQLIIAITFLTNVDANKNKMLKGYWDIKTLFYKTSSKVNRVSKLCFCFKKLQIFFPVLHFNNLLRFDWWFKELYIFHKYNRWSVRGFCIMYQTIFYMNYSNSLESTYWLILFVWLIDDVDRMHHATYFIINVFWKYFNSFSPLTIY